MDKYWIPLQSIPAEGRTLILEDQEIWRSPIKEFGMSCRILTPLRAELFMLPQAQGILFRGRLTGTVSVPCDRCADDSVLDIEHSFDSFEPFPPDPPALQTKDGSRKHTGRKGLTKESDTAHVGDASALDEIDEAVIRFQAYGRGIEINPAGLAWEEFSLALPVKPLCQENCLGLCPICGCNRNTKSCSCAGTEGDPRLAALHKLTIEKKQ